MVVKEENKAGLRRVVNTLFRGGVSILPAFTLYGFSANLFDAFANRKILMLKRRETDKPFIVLASADFILEASEDVDKDLLALLLDAGVTVVVKTKYAFPFYASKNGKSAFRKANTPLLSYLCSFFPLTSTSINISGKSSINDVKTILKRYRKRVGAVVVGGTMNMASTVVELKGSRIVVLRKGCCYEKLGGLVL